MLLQTFECPPLFWISSAKRRYETENSRGTTIEEDVLLAIYISRVVAINIYSILETTMKYATRILFAAAVAALGIKADVSDGSGSGDSESYSDSVSVPKENKNNRFERIAASYGKKGGLIRLCMDGDACTQLMQLKLWKLVEVDEEGEKVLQAKNFNQADYEWSAPAYTLDYNDTKVSMKVGFNARLAFKNSIQAETDFQFSSEIFFQDRQVEYEGTGEYFNVSAGALKFSVNITNWPWQDPANRLKFGIRLKIKTKRGRNANRNPKKRRRGAAKRAIDRLSLGDGVYLDSNEMCVLDGNIGTVATKTDAPSDESDSLDIDWEFPYFENNMYYDPVLGESADEIESEEEDIPEEEDETTPAPTPAPTDGAAYPFITLTSIVFAIAFFFN